MFEEIALDLANLSVKPDPSNISFQGPVRAVLQELLL